MAYPLPKIKQTMQKQAGKRKEFYELMADWQDRVIADAELESLPIRVHARDKVKLEALAALYRLPVDEVARELLNRALLSIEAEMPYIPGPKVIRVEEDGDEVYEDIGPMPRYLELQNRLRKERQG